MITNRTEMERLIISLKNLEEKARVKSAKKALDSDINNILMLSKLSETNELINKIHTMHENMHEIETLLETETESYQNNNQSTIGELVNKSKPIEIMQTSQFQLKNNLTFKNIAKNLFKYVESEGTKSKKELRKFNNEFKTRKYVYEFNEGNYTIMIKNELLTFKSPYDMLIKVINVSNIKKMNILFVEKRTKCLFKYELQNNGIYEMVE